MAGDTFAFGLGGFGLRIPAGGTKEGRNSKERYWAGSTAFLLQQALHGPETLGTLAHFRHLPIGYIYILDRKKSTAKFRWCQSIGAPPEADPYPVSLNPSDALNEQDPW